MTLVAIHQPNFFPWLGFFDKMVRADTFILLDNVQFQKTGGTWTNRVRLLTGPKDDWVTLPVQRDYHGVLPISEMRLQETGFPRWKEKFPKTLRMNYAKHPWFPQVFDLVEDCLDYDGDRLAEFNIRNIKKIMEFVGLPCSHLIRGTGMNCSGNATELLIRLIRAAGGSAYLCGGGAGGYQEDALFAAAGIKLVYQNFKHPIYEQKGRAGFIPGLSILDALFNCGPDGVRAMLTAKPRDK